MSCAISAARRLSSERTFMPANDIRQYHSVETPGQKCGRSSRGYHGHDGRVARKAVAGGVRSSGQEATRATDALRFNHPHKAALDDAPFPAFDRMEEYRHW